MSSLLDRGTRTSVLLVWTMTAFAFALGVSSAQPAQDSISIPKDDSVLDLRRDFGAKGDGVSDDTEALQQGIEASCRSRGKPSKVLFIPNGVYRVSQSIVVKASIGPWVYGQSRDGVVIRLADGITDTNCTAVLRTHPQEKGKTSADWFMRNFRNLTVDVGNNPRIDGIRW